MDDRDRAAEGIVRVQRKGDLSVPGTFHDVSGGHDENVVRAEGNHKTRSGRTAVGFDFDDAVFPVSCGSPAHAHSGSEQHQQRPYERPFYPQLGSSLYQRIAPTVVGTTHGNIVKHAANARLCQSSSNAVSRRSRAPGGPGLPQLRAGSLLLIVVHLQPELCNDSP